MVICLKTNQTAPTFPSYFSHFSLFICSKAPKKIWLCIAFNSSFLFGTIYYNEIFTPRTLLRVFVEVINDLRFAKSSVISQSSSYLTYLQVWNSWLFPHPWDIFLPWLPKYFTFCLLQTSVTAPFETSLLVIDLSNFQG